MGMIAVNKEGNRYINSIIVPKNSEIPSTVTRSYELGVSKKKENRLEVYMLQGEEEQLTYPLNCTVLGKYVFTGIEAMNARKEEIAVTYSYDENNIVNVSARQVSCGKPLVLHIEPVEEDLSWVLEDPREKMKSEGPQMAVYIAIDLSGSMSGDGLKKSKRAAVEFVKQFDLSVVSVGLINFSDEVIIYQDLTNDEETLIRKINSWDINMDGLGYGNSVHPFDIAGRHLNLDVPLKYVVVLTDGVWICQDDAIESAQNLHMDGIEVIAIGFDGADKSFLSKIASRDDFATFTQLDDLAATLTGIAKVM